MKKALLAVALLATPALMPALIAPPVLAATANSKLGDLSKFERIASDTLALVENNDLVAAQKRITDFEAAWDAGEPMLYPKDKTAWGVVDDAADAAISSLRAGKPSATKAKATVSDLLAKLQNPTGK
jgi:sulfur carrier protein ThiS